MELYYSSDLVTLWHGDSAELAAREIWTRADALVTDPPYGMAYSSNKSKYNGPSAPIAGDNNPQARDTMLAQWWADPFNDLEPETDRPALVFGTWRVPRPTATKQLIVWDKGECPGMGDLSLPWGPSHEEVYVMGSGFKGKRGGSVIRSKGLSAGDGNRPNHPTPKPIGLMEALIEKVPRTMVIADPFAGSGSTLIAARNLGRRVIGFELEERYCELTASRLAQAAFDFGGM